MLSRYSLFYRTLLWIFTSACLVGAFVFMGWLYYLHIHALRLNDERFYLTALVENSSQKEGVKMAYLAEILGLSVDKPTHLYAIDLKEAQQKLLRSPVLKQVFLKKILPQTLYIYYQMRVPKAYIGDYLNMAVDEEGVIFPFYPFFYSQASSCILFGRDRREFRMGKLS